MSDYQNPLHRRQVAVSLFPHRLEAWRVAGTSFFRFGPMIGYPAWEARASEALQHALALDSTDALTLIQLIRLPAVTGNRADQITRADASFSAGAEE